MIASCKAGLTNADADAGADGSELAQITGTWSATTSALADNHAPSTWNALHNSWLGRDYQRAGPASPGCAGPG